MKKRGKKDVVNTLRSFNFLKLQHCVGLNVLDLSWTLEYDSPHEFFKGTLFKVKTFPAEMFLLLNAFKTFQRLLG